MNSLIPNMPPQSDALVATFLESKGQATREAYRQDLKCFESYLVDVVGMSSLAASISLRTPELNFVVLKYRDHLINKKLSPSTINRRLGAIRSLFKLARLLGHSAAEIEISNMKAESYRDTRGPGLPAFKRMMAMAADQKEVKAARDRAILRLILLASP